MNLIRAIFRMGRVPKKGEQWIFKNSHSGPWFQSRYNPVTILDVKSGWVRYWVSFSSPDERMLLTSFLWCHEFVGHDAMWRSSAEETIDAKKLEEVKRWSTPKEPDED
jgi:hypothetical protein